MADEDLERIRNFRFERLGEIALEEVPHSIEFFPELPGEMTLAEIYKLLRNRLSEEERLFFEAIGLHAPESEGVIGHSMTPVICLFEVEFVHYIATGRGTVTYARDGAPSTRCEFGPLRWKTLRLLAKLQLAATDDGWVDVRAITLARTGEKALTHSDADLLSRRNPDQPVLTCIARLNSQFPRDQPLIEKQHDDSQVRIRGEVVSRENLVKLASF